MEMGRVLRNTLWSQRTKEPNSVRFVRNSYKLNRTSPQGGGGSLEIKGGAQHDPLKLLQSSGAVESGVSDVRDMNLWLDGQMEWGNAQILSPPRVGKVRVEEEKRTRRW